jgi:hypothetical protein
MEAILALYSEDSRLSLLFPVYSFPLCLQVEHMEVMLAVPSEDWRLNLSVPFFSFHLCLQVKHMEVMLALYSEDSRLRLPFLVYSFPLCLQVEHMEVMLALPSEDWRSDLYRSDSCLHLLKPISLELTFKGRFHEIFGPLLRAFSVIYLWFSSFPKYRRKPEKLLVIMMYRIYFRFSEYSFTKLTRRVITEFVTILSLLF